MYYPFTIVQFIGMEILKNVYCSLSNKKKKTIILLKHFLIFFSDYCRNILYLFHILSLCKINTKFLVWSLLYMQGKF